MNCLILYCFAIVAIGYCGCSIVASITSVDCNLGSDVNFKNPCPRKFDECFFKKFHQRRYIVIRGISANPQKYLLDDNKTSVIMKNCTENDRAIYTWMCTTCNVVEQFHLVFPHLGGI